MRTAVIMIGSNTFRAFSAGNLQLLLPGPMAQAITFRAFGAERVDFDTGSLSLGFIIRPYEDGTVPLAVAGGSLAQRHSPRLVR